MMMTMMIYMKIIITNQIKLRIRKKKNKKKINRWNRSKCNKLRIVNPNKFFKKMKLLSKKMK
jgi:hypothetical protein